MVDNGPVPLLDLKAQYEDIREEVDSAIAEVVASQQFVLGDRVDRLERAVADRLGVAAAVGCNSGTDALLLTLKALDLPAGGEVVVPAFTFFATAGAVWNAGLRPVFADIDPVTFNLTAGTVEAAFTANTCAIIAVHLFGQMAPMAEIMDVAERRGVPVIEDAAQAVGACQEIGGESRPAGSIGVAGCFSFFPTKNLGAYGDGGMIATDDPDLAERLAKLRVHGGRQMYHHEFVGTNSRLDALQAAVLLAKLPHLERWTARRRDNAAFYDTELSPVANVRVPGVLPGNYHVYNQYTIRIGAREEVRASLGEAGIGTGIYYPVPLHLQECFGELGFRAGDFPESERAAAEVLSIPVYPELTEDQRQRVAAAIRRSAGR